MEGVNVHWPRARVHIASERWGANCVPEDSILVGFCNRRMPGMEGAWHRFRIQDPDGDREGPVEGALKVLRGNGGLQLKAGDLGEGVDPGIGAS